MGLFPGVYLLNGAFQVTWYRLVGGLKLNYKSSTHD
jgi:hypothetical protein